MDSMPGMVSTVHSTSHLRACRSCAHFKTRCIPHQDSNIAKCERCHRLNKTCEAQVAAPRKPRKIKSSRTAKLEEKLDGIVCLLTSVHRDAVLQDQATGFPTPNKSSPVTNAESSEPSPLPWSRYAAPDATSQQTALETKTVSLGTFRGIIADQEADYLIEVFRTQIALQFPFVVIPPDISARDLCTNNPFLYRAVMVVASCKNVARQIVLRKDFTSDLCEKVLIESQKSLDILQGLLVFVAWYHYHLPIPQLTNLVQLAIALSVDLGFNRTQKGTEKHEILAEVTKCRAMRLGVREIKLDERRAFLGLFWLTSVLSSFTGIAPIKEISYIEECCYAIKKSSAYPSDGYLVHLVRLQNIVERIRPISVPSYGIDQPLAMYIKMLQTELQQFKDKLPKDLGQNNVLIAQYHSAEISLFELGFHKSSGAISSPENTLHKIRILHQCLGSVKLFLDAYFSLPPALYFTYTIGLFTQVSQAFVLLSKLTLFEHDCWDLSYVCQFLDFSEVLQQLADRFDEAGKGFDVDPQMQQHNDVFSRCARKILRIKAWFDGRHAVDREPEDVQAGGGEAMRAVDDGMVGMQFDLLDEAFWQDMMNDWETMQ